MSPGAMSVNVRKVRSLGALPTLVTLILNVRNSPWARKPSNVEVVIWLRTFNRHLGSSSMPMGLAVGHPANVIGREVGANVAIGRGLGVAVGAWMGVGEGDGVGVGVGAGLPAASSSSITRSRRALFSMRTSSTRGSAWQMVQMGRNCGIRRTDRPPVER